MLKKQIQRTFFGTSTTDSQQEEITTDFTKAKGFIYLFSPVKNATLAAQSYLDGQQDELMKGFNRFKTDDRRALPIYTTLEELVAAIQKGGYPKMEGSAYIFAVSLEPNDFYAKVHEGNFHDTVFAAMRFHHVLRNSVARKELLEDIPVFLPTTSTLKQPGPTG